MKADEKAVLAAILGILSDMKAEDPMILDLRELTTMTDYFVIAHGKNTRQVQAMSRALEERLAIDPGIKPHHVEGFNQGQWVLLDYGWLIVHLFHEDKRTYYGLDRIWMDAPRILP